MGAALAGRYPIITCMLHKTQLFKYITQESYTVKGFFNVTLHCICVPCIKETYCTMSYLNNSLKNDQLCTRGAVVAAFEGFGFTRGLYGGVAVWIQPWTSRSILSSGQVCSSVTIPEDLATKPFSANKLRAVFCQGKGDCTGAQAQLGGRSVPSISADSVPASSDVYKHFSFFCFLFTFNPPTIPVMWNK